MAADDSGTVPFCKRKKQRDDFRIIQAKSTWIKQELVDAAKRYRLECPEEVTCLKNDCLKRLLQQHDATIPTRLQEGRPAPQWLLTAWGEEEMTFGKHTGNSYWAVVRDVPGYAQWVVDLPDKTKAQVHLANFFLQYKHWKSLQPTSRPGETRPEVLGILPQDAPLWIPERT